MRREIETAIKKFFQEKTLEELADEKGMKAAVKSAVSRFEKEFCPKAVSASVDWYYAPLAVNEEEVYPPRDVLVREREFPNGREEDYRAILSLKTEDYKEQSVEDFNAALLECVNEIDDEHFNGIWEDKEWNDFKVRLSDEETAFLNSTFSLSNYENAQLIKSLRKGEPEEPVWISADFGEKYNKSKGSWCAFWYQVSYSIPDKAGLTVGARDRAVGGFQDEMHRFWEDTGLNELLGMTKQEVAAYMKQTASKYSSEQIAITVDENQVSFEHDAGAEDRVPGPGRENR